MNAERDQINAYDVSPSRRAMLIGVGGAVVGLVAGGIFALALHEFAMPPSDIPIWERFAGGALVGALGGGLISFTVAHSAEVHRQNEPDTHE